MNWYRYTVAAAVCLLAHPLLTQAADRIAATITENGEIYVADWNVSSNAFVNFRQIDSLRKSEGLGANTRSCGIGDFNEDGHDDIVATRNMGQDQNLVSLFLNDGSNAFANAGVIAIFGECNTWAMDIAVADVNCDGHLDAMVGGDEGAFAVCLGDGQGNFETRMQSGLERQSRGFDVADVDRDGYPDAVRAVYWSGNLHFLRGRGDGSFDAPVLIADIGGDPYGVTLGDFDGDDLIDVICNDGSGGAVSLLRGNGDGTFQAATLIPEMDFNNHGGFDAFDFDGDGDLDIVACTYATRRLYFFRGFGDGTFTNWVDVGSTPSHCLGVSAPVLPTLSNMPVVVLAPWTQTVGIGEAAVFDGSGSTDADGVIVSNVWHFGDGSTPVYIAGAPLTTSHVYTAEGHYVVKLGVHDDMTNASFGAAHVTVTGAPPVFITNLVMLTESDAADGVWGLPLDPTNLAFDAEGLHSVAWRLCDTYTTGFEDLNVSDWLVFDGTWVITTNTNVVITGAASFRQSNSGVGRARVLQGRIWDSDYAFEADFQMQSGFGEEVFFVIDGQDRTAGYEVLFRGRGINDCRINRTGATATLSNFGLPFALVDFVTYSVRIERRRGGLTVFLNGILLGTVHDSYYTGGRIGFNCYSTDVVFDNVRVTPLTDAGRDPSPADAQDFEDGDADGWYAHAGTWSVSSNDPISGVYSYHQSDASASRGRAAYHKVFDADMAVALDFEILAGTGQEVMVDFYGRRYDATTAYEIIVRGRGLNDVLVRRVVNGGVTTLLTAPLPDALALNTVYALEVRNWRGRMDLYLGTNHLGRVTDTQWRWGRMGMATYQSSVRFDNIRISSLADNGGEVALPAGTNTLCVTAMDAAWQTVTGSVTVVTDPGQPPTADAGGPYTVYEVTNAYQGAWSVFLNGSASTDAVTPVSDLIYQWTLDSGAFDGTNLNSFQWFHSIGVTQSNAVSIVGTGSWGQRYLCSREIVARAPGLVLEARCKPSVGTMIGLKSTDTNYSYTGLRYALYFENGRLVIYEDGGRRAELMEYTPNAWYRIRIVPKPVQGARYYFATDTGPWVLVYDSNYSAITEFRRCVTVAGGSCMIDDLPSIVGGKAPTAHVYGAGIHPLSLAVTDAAGNSHTNTTTVTAVTNNPPVADAGSDQLQVESNAVDSVWTFAFDASSSSDDQGIFLYEWDWDYDGTFVASGDTGAFHNCAWTEPGVYTVAVQVTDHALQTDIDAALVTITPGTSPTAMPNGPYAFNEFTGLASTGAWNVVVDASGSSDNDSSVVQYIWDFGKDRFNGTTLNPEKWIASDGVVQSNSVSMTGIGSWGTRYLYSRDAYTRARGLKFAARVKVPFSYAMFGWKQLGTDYYHTQLQYAMYFNNGSVQIYENGSFRGTVSNYVANAWYDICIELKASQGARYYMAPTGSVLELVYDSAYGSDTRYQRGYTTWAGTVMLDDLCETGAGSNLTYRLYTDRAGTNSISVTVFDQALQTHTGITTMALNYNALPAAGLDGDRYGSESNAVEGIWWFSFNATNSTDDHGIYRYEWDWDYDGSFDASGDEGISRIQAFGVTRLGTNTVAVRVSDHLLQTHIATAEVVLEAGAVPVALAGPDATAEVGSRVTFDGSASYDDVGIARYEWAFGDGDCGVGPRPAHVFWSTGIFHTVLTVYDAANQMSLADTVTVTVVVSTVPVADAGGPYTAGAGGPPAYFDGRHSTDNTDTNVIQAVAQYIWDVDTSTDSGVDGIKDNDVDLRGLRPFYTYSVVGIYTARLSVVDGAGQTNWDVAVVTVVSNLPPDVICVPHFGNTTVDHSVYAGLTARLKGITRDAGALTFQWDFGDGSTSSVASVTDPYEIEATHVYTGSIGKPFLARLTVWDAQGLSASDTYRLIMRADTTSTRADVAVDEGLWWLHKDQDRSGTIGRWISHYSGYPASSAGAALHAFQVNGHRLDGEPQQDPYVETVNLGFDYMFSQLRVNAISPFGGLDPDSNGNGIGIDVSSGRPIYETGVIMDAIAVSESPLGVARTGPANVQSRFFSDILRDMVDMYAHGQVDSGGDTGGWRYSWNSDADNSASQWGAIGMLAAKDRFGIPSPDFVKSRNRTWLSWTHDGTHYGYENAGTYAGSQYLWHSTSASAMIQMAFDGVVTTNALWRATEDAIAASWPVGSAVSPNYYSQYTLSKAMRLARPSPIVSFQRNGLDWYNDPSVGMEQKIVSEQHSAGYWDKSWASPNYQGLSRDLSTAWAVLILTPSLFVQPPVAVIEAPTQWRYGNALTFDAANSFHLDPVRSLVSYWWDFNGDGLWDLQTSNPSDPAATYTYPDPNVAAGDPPTNILVRLRVQDDNTPAQTDITTWTLTVRESPVTPFADVGGPYTGSVNVPLVLDGSGSFDLDPGDSLTLYQWDFDLDDVPDISTNIATAQNTYSNTGVYTVGLRVWDNGAFNGGTNLVSEWDYSAVTINRILTRMQWWSLYMLINTNLTANDFSAVNQGQLKWAARQAYLAMDATLTGGAGAAVSNTVSSFTGSNNFQAVNLGQLKAVAKPFYDRLGLPYPWTGAATTNNHALANSGQLKNVFGFDITD